jgi:hypothetical protein
MTPCSPHTQCSQNPGRRNSRNEEDHHVVLCSTPHTVPRQVLLYTPQSYSEAINTSIKKYKHF